MDEASAPSLDKLRARAPGWVRTIRDLVLDAGPAAEGLSWLCGVGEVFFGSLKGFFAKVAEMGRERAGRGDS